MNDYSSLIIAVTVALVGVGLFWTIAAPDGIAFMIAQLVTR